MAALNKHLGWINIAVTITMIVISAAYTNGKNNQKMESMIKTDSDLKIEIDECRKEIKSLDDLIRRLEIVTQKNETMIQSMEKYYERMKR